MSAMQSVVGCTGVLVHATRGTQGPREALVRIRGTREAYTAFADEELPVGQAVLVVADRGLRCVDVVAWTSPETDTGTDPCPGPAPSRSELHTGQPDPGQPHP